MLQNGIVLAISLFLTTGVPFLKIYYDREIAPEKARQAQLQEAQIMEAQARARAARAEALQAEKDLANNTPSAVSPPSRTPAQTQSQPQSPQTRNVVAPRPPKMVELFARSSREGGSGGMTEIMPGSQAFLTAAHVFEGQSLEKLRDSFRANGLELNQYRFFYFRTSDGTNGFKDVVLLIPKGRESMFLESADPAVDPSGIVKCRNDGSPIPLRLMPSPYFQKYIAKGDQYLSHQFGKIGSRDTSQISRGQIDILDRIDGFFLPFTPENHSTLRSSGALVYTTRPSPNASPQEIEWKIGGVIECETPPSTNKGVRDPGGIRVSSSSGLLNSDVIPVSLNEVLRKKDRGKDGCIPIDGRAGGG
jgi:hypothetical protein